MTAHRVEVESLRHGLAAVLIPRGLTAAQERAIRERLGLTCRHGRNVRAAYGRCPACAVDRNRLARGEAVG